jgi:hypothetical protein
MSIKTAATRQSVSFCMRFIYLCPDTLSSVWGGLSAAGARFVQRNQVLGSAKSRTQSEQSPTNTAAGRRTARRGRGLVRPGRESLKDKLLSTSGGGGSSSGRQHQPAQGQQLGGSQAAAAFGGGRSTLAMAIPESTHEVRETASFFEFPYVCPEPVLAK